MIRRVPPEASFFDLSHVLLGFAALVLGAACLYGCTGHGRWRLYFPWLGGHAGPLARDLAGLLRGRRPMSEGGGLLGCIEGLLLLALLATGASGAGWFAAQGTEAVLAWRGAHLVAARTFAVLLLLHAAGAALHLVDLVRD
jgi:hypothetical protein